MVCVGRGCGWSKPLDEDESSRAAFQTHQAAVLAPLLVAAQAAALREAADAMQEERRTWCLDDAGRYWIKRTLDELRERGTVLEAEADPEGRALVQAIHDRKESGG
jgi:hypothetical protein